MNDEAWVKHLEFIQGVIARMARNSLIIKGWSITVVAAIVALVEKDSRPLYVLLAILPAGAFWALDAYYLRQERLFRKLYDAVRVRDDAVEPFSMNAQPFESKVHGTFPTMFAAPLLYFHLILLLGISAIALILTRT